MRACEEHDTPIPEWQTLGGDFWTTFYFANTDQETDQEITEEIKSLLKAFESEKSRLELMDLLNLSHRGNFRKLYLQPALEQGLVAMTLPDKPQSSYQKYYLTSRGKTSEIR